MIIDNVIRSIISNFWSIISFMGKKMFLKIWYFLDLRLDQEFTIHFFQSTLNEYPVAYHNMTIKVIR